MPESILLVLFLAELCFQVVRSREALVLGEIYLFKPKLFLLQYKQ